MSLVRFSCSLTQRNPDKRVTTIKTKTVENNAAAQEPAAADPDSDMKGSKAKYARSIVTLMASEATLMNSSIKNNRIAHPHRCQGGIPSCNQCAKTTSTTRFLVASFCSNCGALQILSTIVRRALRTALFRDWYSTTNGGRFSKSCHKMRISPRRTAKMHPMVIGEGLISFSLLVSLA